MCPAISAISTYLFIISRTDCSDSRLFAEDAVSLDVPLFTGKEGGMSPKSVRNIHTMLHSALQMAVGKIILKNPTEETTRPPVPEK